VNIQSETISATRKSYTVTVPSNIYQEEEKNSLSALSRQVKIPGFRPGKVPVNMLLQRYGKELTENVKQGVVQKVLDAVLQQEKNLNSFVEVGELEKVGDDYQVRVVADVVPDFDLPEYVGIEVKLPEVRVTEEDVDQELESLRLRRAEFKVSEAPAKAGDYVKISYEAELDGKPLKEVHENVGVYGSQETSWEEVAAESPLLPEVSKALDGKKAGETFEVQEKFADDHSQEALRGLTVHYKVTVQEVRERVKPELNEEFFKSLKVAGLDDLRESLRKDLLRNKENRDLESQRNEIIRVLSDGVSVEIPQSMLDRHADQTLRRMVNENLQRGVPQSILEQHRDELFESARKNADAQVKVNLILKKIAEKEDIRVAQEDLSEAIYRQAYYSGQNPKKIISEIRKDRSLLTSLSSDILLQKTMAWLVEKAKVVREEKAS
jgi:trigger factor